MTVDYSADLAVKCLLRRAIFGDAATAKWLNDLGWIGGLRALDYMDDAIKRDPHSNLIRKDFAELLPICQARYDSQSPAAGKSASFAANLPVGHQKTNR